MRSVAACHPRVGGANPPVGEGGERRGGFNIVYRRATSQGDDARLGRVRARVHNLAFTAFMDRDCSWWNPQYTGLPHEYILEHEQIHFALFEIAARRLNQQAARIQERMETVSRTRKKQSKSCSGVSLPSCRRRSNRRSCVATTSIVKHRSPIAASASSGGIARSTRGSAACPSTRSSGERRHVHQVGLWLLHERSPEIEAEKCLRHRAGRP